MSTASNAQDFNPRSPCGERLFLHIGFLLPTIFQSTLPVRGATRSRVYRWLSIRNFNPRSPCGERLAGMSEDNARLLISIHAPRAGSDGVGSSKGQTEQISIHAPRAGSDVPGRVGGTMNVNFNPRSPCGERHGRLEWLRAEISFQSTLPVRGATTGLQGLPWHDRDFNPRSPCGERPGYDAVVLQIPHFNPRSPCGERPGVRGNAAASGWNFNPRSPCGERLGSANKLGAFFDFNPRSPCGERPEYKHNDSLLIDFNPRSPCGERRCAGK